MFCRKCGKEINDDAVVCVHCGCAVEDRKQVSNTQDFNTPKTGMGILMGLFLQVIGLIIGIAIYPEGTVARKSFIKAWAITFGIVIGLGIVLGIAFGVMFDNLIESMPEMFLKR